MTTAPQWTCKEMREVAPELALGSLGGSDRALALAHLQSCGGCRELVDELANVADGLLAVAPPVEPPLGFESRVMARLAGSAPAGTEPTPVPAGARTAALPVAEAPRRRRRAAVLAAAAAAVVLLGLGFLGGSELVERGGSHAATPAIRLATASGDWGRPVCQVFAYPGRPSVVVVNVDSPGEAGMYTVELVTTSRTVPLGTIQVTDGKGSLGAVANVDLATAKSVRVLEGDGKVLYDAVFRPA